MIGIYKITSPNNRIYIGQSWNIEKRFKNYEILDCKGQPKLYNSLKKYGPKNHKFEIIKEFATNINQEILDLNEIENISSIPKEISLNIKEGGSKGKHCEDTKKLIGLKNKKPKPKGFGSTISKRLIGNQYSKGLKRTPEQKLNYSKSIKGKKLKCYKTDKLILEEIKSKYDILSLGELCKEFNISVPTMLVYLKKNKIYEFRKNYKK